MTSRSDVERVLDRYLADGAEQVPDRVVDAALDQIEHTNQRRALRVPWRFHDMSSVFKLALAGAAVVAILVVGSMFLIRGPTANIGGPGNTTPSPVSAPPSSASSPTTAPSPGPIDTSSWTTYTSARYGLSVAHPPDWTVEPGDHDWTLEADAQWPNTAADRLVNPGGSHVIAVWSVAVDPETDLVSWIEAYCARNTTPCEGIRDRAVPAYAEPRDRHPGLLVPFKDDVQVFFLNGERLYVVASWRPDGPMWNSRRLAEAMALSMCLGCGELSGSPSPS